MQAKKLLLKDAFWAVICTNVTWGIRVSLCLKTWKARIDCFGICQDYSLTMPKEVNQKTSNWERG
jgi:hypothetical protein